MVRECKKSSRGRYGKVISSEKEKREDAVRGNKEGRKVRKQRISRRKLYEEAWEKVVRENVMRGGFS